MDQESEIMKYAELIKAVNEIFTQYTVKLTLRQIYYRLVSKNLIPNTKASYKGLSHQLVKARESGEVDDSRIEDRSRKKQGNGDYGYEDSEDFVEDRVQRLKDSWEYFTLKQWTDQPKQVIVALEKDALSRLFVDIADGYRINVYATRGYGSYTFVNDMAGDLNKDKEVVVLYFGDYDPSGRDIQRDLKERLVKYCGRDDFTVVRIALTPEQIAEYNLPPMPEDKETLAKLQRDPRTKTYGMTYAVELDAIEPNELQKLIKSAIIAQIDHEKWQARMKESERLQQELKSKLETVIVTIEGEEF
jgi:hypothetical protein